MKKVIYLVIISLIFFINSKIYSSNDECGTTATSSTRYLPTSGNIKILVIFAQFKDDPNTDNNGWAKNTYPSWANTFINSSPNSSYPWNNLSHYFNEMSNGSYQVIGDVYNSLVITDYNESHYSSIGEVNREIIMEVDPNIDFSQYDNLNGSSFGSDGKVDYVNIIYRNATSSAWWYTAIAHLEVSSTINVDGKQIVNTSSGVGGGVQQRSGYVGRDYTMYTAAHEMGHYLFGGGHINYATNLCLMSDLPVWNGSRGMHSWEREDLGWINYTDVSVDTSVTLSDYMTNDTVYRVPGNDNEYFLIENRKKISSHDKAADVGFYFYRITSAQNYYPTIDVLCADGNWDFSINTSTQTLTRTTQNENGKDEMNYRNYESGITYVCRTPFYHENSAWGDTEDAFDLTFNNVLSPKSNPSTINNASINFAIEVTGSNTLKLYFTSPYSGSPSKPQNIHVAWSGDHPQLTWESNTEPDMQSYKISKMVEGETGWATVATVPHDTSLTTHSWTDVNVDKPGKFDPVYTIHYKIRAYDTQSKYSVYSEEKEIDATTDYLWKKHEDLAEEELVITEYSLNQNYPNPFNPVTTISYQLPEKGQVVLKIYNSLGKEIKELVNGYQTEGRYAVKFDGSDSQGDKLPSGVYFYKIIVSNASNGEHFTDTKKLILMK